jgi:hypothetical protein
MSTLSASDLTHLTRLASSMPEGSVQRRAILTALRDHRAEPKTAGLNKKASRNRIGAILTRKRMLISGRGRTAAIRLASMMPKGSEERQVLLNGLRKRATVRTAADPKAAAAKWVEEALVELAEEEGLDADDLKVRGKTGWGYGVNVEGRGRGDSGESEWALFEDWDDAEKEAYDYVRNMLEEEPEMFNQDWLENYMSVSSTDARIIGGEEADNRIDGMDDEDLLRNGDLEDKWQDLEDEKDEIEYGEARDADDADDAALDKRVAQIEKEQSKLIDEARDEVLLNYAAEVEDQLNRDPLEWYRELTGERDIPDWISVDVEKAAKAALRDDGVAHFLDNYDGDSTELPSGAVAFGTN